MENQKAGISCGIKPAQSFVLQRRGIRAFRVNTMKKYYVYKISAVFLGMMMLFYLVGCSSPEQSKYPEYDAVENTELGCIELHYEGIIFRPYGVFGHKGFRGNQIGVRKGDPESRICEVKGYEAQNWIIEHLNVLMGGGDMLCKAVTSTAVPYELEQYRQYDY